MKKKNTAKRAELKHRSALVRQGARVPVGTIIGDADYRMVVTGHGYYDLDANRSEVPGESRALMYEGEVVRLNQARRRIEFVRNSRGEKVEAKMRPADVRAVLMGEVVG